MCGVTFSCGPHARRHETMCTPHAHSTGVGWRQLGNSADDSDSDIASDDSSSEDSSDSDAPNEEEQLEEQHKDTEQESRPTCVVCLDRMPEVALVPCGHQNFCALCAYQWKEESGHCPIDRKQITMIMRLIPL